MEVVGSDENVGTVDHMEGWDRIKLSKNDPAAGGKHHFIDIESVKFVDDKIHLDKPSTKAMSEWQA